MYLKDLLIIICHKILRIYNILEKLNLKELIFDNNSERIINFNKDINYVEIEKKLSDLRNHSLVFFKDSLKKATEYNDYKRKNYNNK